MFKIKRLTNKPLSDCQTRWQGFVHEEIDRLQNNLLNTKDGHPDIVNLIRVYNELLAPCIIQRLSKQDSCLDGVSSFIIHEIMQYLNPVFFIEKHGKQLNSKHLLINDKNVASIKFWEPDNDIKHNIICNCLSGITLNYNAFITLYNADRIHFIITMEMNNYFKEKSKT